MTRSRPTVGTVLLVNKFLHYSGGVEFVVDRYAAAVRGMGMRVAVLGQSPEGGQPTAAFAEHADVLLTIPPVASQVSANPALALPFMERALIGRRPRSAVLELLEREPIRVAIVFNAYHQIGFSYLHRLRMAGVRTVLSLHDYKPGCTNYRFFDEHLREECRDCSKSAMSYLHRPIVRGCVKGSRVASAALVLESASQRLRRTYSDGFDRAIVLNSLQQEVMVRAGMSPSDVTVIPNAVDPALLHWAGDPSSHALYVGRLASEKGVGTLIDAAAAAGRALVIVGDGPERPRLQARAQAAGGDVRFLGWLAREEVSAQMRSAGLLAVPSEWPEVFPLVVCEAMVMGLPVLASDTGGHRDLLGGGRGLLLPARNPAAWAHALRDSGPRCLARAQLARRYAETELSPSRWSLAIERFIVESAARL